MRLVTRSISATGTLIDSSSPVMVAWQCLQFMSGIWKTRSCGSVISSSGSPGIWVISMRSSSATKVST